VTWEPAATSFYNC